MRKLVISLIFTMVLTACGGGKSSSESEANKSNGAVDQNANTSSIGVSGINLERDGKVEAPFIVVTNISFSPTSGKLSKSKSSLRGKVTFEYDTDHFKNGSGLNDIFFAYIVIEGKGGLRLVSDNPAGKIDLHNGKGGALVSFSISEAELGSYSSAEGVFGIGTGNSGLDLTFNKKERVNFTVVE